MSLLSDLIAQLRALAERMRSETGEELAKSAEQSGVAITTATAATHGSNSSDAGQAIAHWIQGAERLAEARALFESGATRLEEYTALLQSGSGTAGGSASRPAAPPPRPVSASGWDIAPDLAKARDSMDRLGEVVEMRRIHILDGDGDGFGGGHRWDSEIPGKTKFPHDWEDDRIIAAISDVARNPDQPPEARMAGGWECLGVRDRVEILAVINRDGSVWTGHPVRGAGVETNPK